MGRKTKSPLENLQLAIHGVAAPFYCEGDFTPSNPVTLVFPDKSQFEVARAKNAYEQTDTVKPLLDRCKPAPFGDGKKTRYDRRVRDALQLNAGPRGFDVSRFDPESAGILERIRCELIPHDPNPITAKLYTLNVYSNGGHFAPHKDTPRGNNMFGTLVVSLPSQFHGGDLILTHRGVVHKVSWGHAIAQQANPNELHWAAFFGDVDHEIEQVWGGARITLTYLLRHGAASAPARDDANKDLAPLIQAAWQVLLADKEFLPKGGVVGYPCCHLYHQDARCQRKPTLVDREFSNILKSRDHLVAATAIRAGLRVTFNPYMFENSADQTWQLERFPTAKEKSYLGWQMEESDLEAALPILASSTDEDDDFGVTWLESPPSSANTSRQSAETRDPERPAAALLHSCDYCPWGYFGNESSESDFYTFAALHVEIPKFGKAPRTTAKSAPRSAVKRGRSPRKRAK